MSLQEGDPGGQPLDTAHWLGVHLALKVSFCFSAMGGMAGGVTFPFVEGGIDGKHLPQ